VDLKTPRNVLRLLQNKAMKARGFSRGVDQQQRAIATLSQKKGADQQKTLTRLPRGSDGWTCLQQLAVLRLQQVHVCLHALLHAILHLRGQLRD